MTLLAEVLADVERLTARVALLEATVSAASKANCLDAGALENWRAGLHRIELRLRAPELQRPALAGPAHR